MDLLWNAKRPSVPSTNTRASRKAEVKTFHSQFLYSLKSQVSSKTLPATSWPPSLFSPLKNCEEYAVKSFPLQDPLILFFIRTLALKQIRFSSLGQEFILKGLLLGRQSEKNWNCSQWELSPAELLHVSRRWKQKTNQGHKRPRSASCHADPQHCDLIPVCNDVMVWWLDRALRSRFPGLSLLKTAPTHLILLVCYILMTPQQCSWVVFGKGCSQWGILRANNF